MVLGRRVFVVLLYVAIGVLYPRASSGSAGAR